MADVGAEQGHARFQRPGFVTDIDRSSVGSLRPELAQRFETGQAGLLDLLNEGRRRIKAMADRFADGTAAGTVESGQARADPRNISDNIGRASGKEREW